MSAFFAVVWDVVLELAPWMLLGALVAGVLHVVLPPGFVARHLKGRAGVLKAVALGVPLPLCSCGVIPAGLGLKKDGASDGAAVGFLISTPQTGVDSVLVSASFLGWPFALFKVAAAAVTGIVGGLLTDKGGGHGLEVEPAAPPEPHPRTLREVVTHAVEVVQPIYGWLIFGVLVSAAITTWVPADGLANVGLAYGLAAMALALVVSLPMYVCATASVPIAAALVSAGLPTGAALVFLMAGPATNVATIGAVYRTLGGRTLAIYLGTIVVGSMGFGLVFDGLIPTTVELGHAHEHGAGWVAIGSAVLLTGMVAWFFVADMYSRGRRFIESRKPPAEEKTEVAVTGLTCGGCVRKLEGALRGLDGVGVVTVELETGHAVVEGVSQDVVFQAVRDAGFTPAEWTDAA
jgi:uncharacterized membrane protein YraQ (UPF0718 family)/copper chaperone CopZ